MKLKEFFAKTQGSRQLRLTGQKENAMCGRDFWARYRNTEAWEMEVNKVTMIPARATIGALWFDTVICEIELDAEQKPKEAADNLEFLRDFLEGKTRWTFPEGTTFNVTVGVNGTSGMETTQKGAEKEPPAGPEPVTLGPGTSFRMENTSASGPRAAEDGKKNDVLLALKELCRWSKSKEDGGEYRWKRYTEALKFAISVLSELEEIREVRIQAQTDTPGAWELMRDILAGKRPAPEGTVFDVVIDVTGNPQAIRRREEAEAAPRMLAISMPGGETVKLNSAAEAYKLAGCIEEMAARVWPEAAPGK